MVLECARGPEPVSPPPSGLRSRTPAVFRTGEFTERQRGFKKCACTIFVSGTLAGRFRRQRTGKTTWDDARACAAAFEATGSWDGKPIVAERRFPQPRLHRASRLRTRLRFTYRTGKPRISRRPACGNTVC